MSPEGRRARRAELDRVFGDVLPETTGDERDENAGGADGPDGGVPHGDDDERLRREVPPHHG